MEKSWSSHQTWETRTASRCHVLCDFFFVAQNFERRYGMEKVIKRPYTKDKHERMQLRLSKEEKDFLRARAQESGCSMTQYIMVKAMEGLKTAPSK
jgi:hypothetical protein